MSSQWLSVLAVALVGSVTATDPRLLQRDTAPPATSKCFEPTQQPIYKDNYECPKKNPNLIKLNPDGSCGTLSATGASPCTQYCEIKLAWNYGPEITFNTQCQAEDNKCSITDTEGVSVTNSHSFDVGFSLGKRDDLIARKVGDPASALDRIKGAFNFGASWSWSDTTSSATATTHTKPDNADGQCGYWAFIPFYVTSCGSLTYADYTPARDPATGGFEFKPATCGEPKTIGNFCQSTPYTDSNGKAKGATVFVAQDCQSGKQLSFCYQQPAYLQPGVSVNPDVFISWLFARDWKDVANRDTSKPATQSIVNMCFKDQWAGPFVQDPNWKDDGLGHAKQKTTDPSKLPPGI